MNELATEPILQRLQKIEAIINSSGLEKEKKNISNFLLSKESLLDAFLVLYDECNNDSLKKDKIINEFIDKYHETINELRHLRVNINDFEQKKIIGKGNFGIVRVVREKQSGNVFALKTLRKADTLAQQHIAFYEVERDIMAKAVSPWVTHLQYAFHDDQNLYLLMDFHPGGDLLSLLDRFNYRFTESMTRFYLSEITVGIHAVHSMGYVHRDIKPDNILIDRCGHIKLADFGSAAKLTSSKLVRSQMPVGTPDYIAPEVLSVMNKTLDEHSTYGIECDYWSMGIMAYEMLYGETPFKGQKVVETYSNIMNHKDTLAFTNTEEVEVSELAKDLIRGLLEEYNQRLLYDGVTKHKFFFLTDWNNLESVHPPFIPVVTTIDDTSNFEDFENDSPLINKGFPGVKAKNFSGQQLPFVGFTYTRLCNDYSSTRSLANVTLNSTQIEDILNEPSQLKAKKKELHEAQMKIEKLNSEHSNILFQMEKRTVAAETRASLCEKVMKEAQKRLSEQEQKTQKLKHDLVKQKTDRANVESKTLDILKNVKQKWVKEKQELVDYYEGKIKLSELALEKVIDEKYNVTKQLREQKVELSHVKEEANQYRSLLSEKSEELTRIKKEIEENAKEKLEETLVLVESEKKNKLALLSQIEELKKKNYDHELQLAQLFAADRENEKLLKDIDSFKIELAKKQKDNEDLQSHFKKMHDESIYAESCKFEEINQELKLKKEECETLQKQLQEMTTKFNKCLTTHVNNEDVLLSKNEELKARIKEIEEELSLVIHDKAQLSDELSMYSSMSEKQKENLQESEALLALFNESFVNQENKDTEQKLAAQIELLEKQLAASQNSVAAEKEKFHNAESELKKKTREHTDMKLDIKVAQRESKSYQDTIQFLRDRSRELKDQVKEKEDEIQKHEDEEEKLKNEITTLQVQLQESKNNNQDSLQLEKQKLLEMGEKLKNQEERLGRMHELRTELRTLKLEKDNLTTEKCTLESRIKVHEKEQELSLERESSLKQKIKELETELANSQSMIVNLKEVCSEQDNQLLNLDSVEQKISALENDKKSLKKEIEELQAELKSSRSFLNEEKSLKMFQQRKVLDLEMKISSLDEEHDILIASLKQQIDELSKNNIELNNEVSALEEQLSEASVKENEMNQEKIKLNSELDILKEESSGHIRYIHSLKESTFKLTDALEEAVTKGEIYKKKNEGLEENLKQLQTLSDDQELKMTSTIHQQTKLIDFLQAKSEQPKKKMALSKLFSGSKDKENSNYITPHQYRKMEDLLEQERSHTKQLSAQLSKAHYEIITLKANRAQDSKKALSLQHPPSTPTYKNALEDISNSPSFENTKQRMRHKIPHRWQWYLVMRAGRCGGCLGNVPFSRNAFRCQDCGTLAHQKCYEGIGNTCGLPEEFALHYSESFKKIAKESKDNNAKQKEAIIKGWIKIPRTGKNTWERKFGCLMEKKLEFFDQDEEFVKPFKTIDLIDSVVIVHNSVPKSERPNENESELPYIIKIEVSNSGTSLSTNHFIKTSTFEDKQKWISALEMVSETNCEEDSNTGKGRIEAESIITLKAVTPLDVNSLVFLNDKIAVVGAAEGLFSFERNEEDKLKFKARIEGMTSIHQIILVKSVGVAVFIGGEENLVFQNDLQTFEVATQASQVAKPSISPIRIDPLMGCHLVTASQYSSQKTFLCAAASDRISILIWSTKNGRFAILRQYSTQEPCSCLLFTPNSLIVGSERFYKIDLKSYAIKEFLDGNDSTLAYAIYGSAQMSSFPVAVIQISSLEKREEYFLAFYEFAVFVDAEGKRTREFDLKFTKLPVAIIFRSPHLFILHQNAVEVFEIKPESFTKVRGRSFDSDIDCAPIVRSASRNMIKPRFVGNSMKSGSIIVASSLEKELELLSLHTVFPEDFDTSSTWSTDASVQNQPFTSEESDESMRSDFTDPNNSNFSFKRTRFPSCMRASKKTKKHNI